MAELQLPKLIARVRFPSLAPYANIEASLAVLAKLDALDQRLATVEKTLTDIPNDAAPLSVPLAEWRYQATASDNIRTMLVATG